jgi:hypothetical protein
MKWIRNRISILMSFLWKLKLESKVNIMNMRKKSGKRLKKVMSNWYSNFRSANFGSLLLLILLTTGINEKCVENTYSYSREEQPLHKESSPIDHYNGVYCQPKAKWNRWSRKGGYFNCLKDKEFVVFKVFLIRNIIENISALLSRIPFSL